MIVQFIKRKVFSDKSVAHCCQVICSVVAGLVLVLGFRRLAALELTEAQLFTAATETLLLTGVFIILGFQFRAWGRES